MFRLLPQISRGFLVLLAASLTPATFLHADDKAPQAPEGYKMVPVKQGDHTSYIQVKETTPYKNTQEPDPNDHRPDHFSFNKTSSFADKSYASDQGTSYKGEESYQKNLERTFITKSYFPDKKDGEDTTTPGLHNQVPVTSAERYLHRADGFDKSFLTASADPDQHKNADFAAKSSSYQGRTALLGGHEVKAFADPMSDKVYAGPEAEVIKQETERINKGLSSMKDLPDRALTIDEVRALINHGIKPDLEEKAAEPSKPLNDPGYMPDDAPAPMRPSPTGHLHDINDAAEGVPDPGTMAAPQPPPPENAEPLPQ